MKKLLGITIFLSVIVAIAGTMADLEFFSDKFMEESVTMAQPGNSPRYIASNTQNEMDVFFPVNEKNSALINGMWVMTKYTYKYNLGEKMNIDAYVELIANARVEVTFIVREKNGKEREVSLKFDMMEELTKNDKVLRLINIVGDNDSETLELIRKVEKKEKAEVTKEEKGVEGKENSEEVNEDDMDLVVISAQNPVKDKNAKTTSGISGNITIVDGVIEELNVTVEDKSVSFGEEIVLKTAGIFNTTYEGEHVSARYTKLSDSSAKIRFFSGPLSGNIIVFGTEDIRENKIQAMEEALEESQERVSRFDGQPYYDRNSDQVRNVASTPEEMEDKAEQTGFDFSQDYE